MKKILPLLMLGTLPLCASHMDIYRLECNQTSPCYNWTTKQADWASQGSFIQAPVNHSGDECDPLDFSLPLAGTYQLAVRYLAVKDSRTNFAVLIRNAQQEVVQVEYIDWCRILPTAKPYLKPQGASVDGPAWHRFAFTAEVAGDYRISVMPLIYGKLASLRKVDCILIGTKLPDNLDQFTPEALAKVPLAPAPQGNFDLPRLETYAGNHQKPFLLGLINCGSMTIDAANQVLLGMNRDHGTGWLDTDAKPNFVRKTYAKSGFKTLSEAFSMYRPDLDRKFPRPMGRFVNADGEVGSSFSLSFKPYWDEINKSAVEAIKTLDKTGFVDCFSFSVEWGGQYDYSDVSLAAFRTYLQKKYTSLDQLNQAWKTTFTQWKNIRPPKNVTENPAAYYDFQTFSGQVFADLLAERVDLIEKHARNAFPTTQFSNLYVFTAFKNAKPIDYEQVYRTAFKDRGIFGWDSYCVDDYMGAEIDYLHSITNGMPLCNHETNVHSENPDLLTRTFWVNVAKGTKGVYLFMNQEGVYHDSYPKWALHNPDFSHKDKLGAVSDAVHEVHRFEPLLVSAKRQTTVKPIMIYYSQLDALTLKPLLSAWGEGPNNPYRVYEMFRALGYPVRYVTPLMIAEGKLQEGAALVLSQTSVIPEETRQQIEAYIRQGGVAIADMKPGIDNARNEVSPQLMKLFGVKSNQPPKRAKSSKLALQESIQGYGEMTISAIENKDLPSSVFEMYQQTDSNHPVLKGLAPFTISGMGMQQITCVDGEVIGMCFGGQPGIVVNTPGKGKTLYLAGMLGTIFGSSCSTYEFDDAHAGLAPFKLLDNFLAWAGAKPAATLHLPPKVAHKVRVEDPLVDDRGNVMLPMVSYNDMRLPQTTMDLVWPKSLTAPKHLFAFTDKERNLVPISPVTLADGRIRITMPPFTTHAALLAMKDFTPVIALTCPDQKPGQMLSAAPGTTLTFKATVHAMSDQPLKAGSVKLSLPLGWTSDIQSVAIPQMPPWGQHSFTFDVTAPAFRNLRKVRPVTLRFTNQDLTSTPATFVLWFD